MDHFEVYLMSHTHFTFAGRYLFDVASAEALSAARPQKQEMLQTPVPRRLLLLCRAPALRRLLSLLRYS